MLGDLRHPDHPGTAAPKGGLEREQHHSDKRGCGMGGISNGPAWDCSSKDVQHHPLFFTHGAATTDDENACSPKHATTNSGYVCEGVPRKCEDKCQVATYIDSHDGAADLANK